MKALEAKVLFELNKDGGVTVEVNGRKTTAKASVLTIIERLAELEERNILDLLSELTEVAKMKEETPFGAILMDILGDIFGEESDEETGDGDCENCDKHAEMPQEVKDLFDKMFGGKN